MLRHSRRALAGEKVVEVSRSVYRSDRFTLWVQLGQETEPTERGHRLTRLLAHPDRVGSAEVRLDVERVLRGVAAGLAQRPPAHGLEQRVLDVLGDQPGDVHLALGPLLGPPLRLDTASSRTETAAAVARCCAWRSASTRARAS